MAEPLVNLSPQQAGDVKTGDMTGRDKYSYEGVPFGQVAELLTRWLDKAPQQEQLAIGAIDGVERQLGRVATLLAWLASAMLAQAIFTALALFLGLWALLSLVGPELVAGR